MIRQPSQGTFMSCVIDEADVYSSWSLLKRFVNSPFHNVSCVKQSDFPWVELAAQF